MFAVHTKDMTIYIAIVTSFGSNEGGKITATAVRSTIRGRDGNKKGFHYLPNKINPVSMNRDQRMIGL